MVADGLHHREDRAPAAEGPSSDDGSVQVSRDGAARLLAGIFLSNAAAGDNAANDELITEMCRRMNARRSRDGARRR